MTLRNVTIPLAIALAFSIVDANSACAAEPVTLLGTIVKWRYPDAEIGPSEMSDAATIDGAGKRTVPSTLLKTTMTTPDPVSKVLAFYRNQLASNAENRERLKLAQGAGQSVLFSNESEGRPFELHTILVNSPHKSTVIVISRGKSEQQTHITWKQYIAHQINN